MFENLKKSHMVKAMKELSSGMTAVDSTPNGLWGHSVTIKTGSVTIRNSELDCEFDIPFDDDTLANESTVTVYNLSDQTISNIKLDNVLTVNAGYTGDTGIILSGRISKVTTRHDGVDKRTVINVIDDVSLRERKIDSIAYKKGVKASYILKDLIGKLGLPIAEFKVAKDYTYKEAVNVDGGLMDRIDHYSEVCGVSTYINKGKVYCKNISDGKSKSADFTVSVDTGLVGSPEPFEEETIDENDKAETIRGYNIKMLMQYRITTASTVELKSRDANGTFVVRSGRHTYDGTNLMTEIEVIE